MTHRTLSFCQVYQCQLRGTSIIFNTPLRKYLETIMEFSFLFLQKATVGILQWRVSSGWSKPRSREHSTTTLTVPGYHVPPFLLHGQTQSMSSVGGNSHTQGYGWWCFCTPQCEPSHLVNPHCLESLGSALASMQTTRTLPLCPPPVSTAGAPRLPCVIGRGMLRV